MSEPTATLHNFPNGGEDFKPVITHEQMAEIEKKYSSESGVNRRVLLALLTQNRATLDKLGDEHPETLIDAFDCGVRYFASQCEFMSMMQTACYRLAMVIKELPDEGVREDQFEAFEAGLDALASHSVKVSSPTD